MINKLLILLLIIVLTQSTIIIDNFDISTPNLYIDSSTNESSFTTYSGNFFGNQRTISISSYGNINISSLSYTSISSSNWLVAFNQLEETQAYVKWEMYNNTYDMSGDDLFLQFQIDVDIPTIIYLSLTDRNFITSTKLININDKSTYGFWIRKFIEIDRKYITSIVLSTSITKNIDFTISNVFIINKNSLVVLINQNYERCQTSSSSIETYSDKNYTSSANYIKIYTFLLFFVLIFSL